MKQTPKHTNIVTHDFITGLFVKLFKFVKTYKTAVITVLAVVIVAALALTGYCVRKHNNYQEQWAQYFLSSLNGTAEAEAAKVELENEFADDPAGLLYKYNMAEVLYAEGNFQAALDLYKAIEHDGNKEFKALAKISAAACYNALGQMEESMISAQSFLVANPDHFASAQAYLLIAMAQEALGQTADAKATYTLITERFAPGYFDTFAKNKLKEIK